MKTSGSTSAVNLTVPLALLLSQVHASELSRICG